MGFGYAVYFTERLKNRVVRWEPDSGNVDVVAGEPPDGDRNQVLRDPYGLVFDRQGTLIIADKARHRICRLVNGRLVPISLQDPQGRRARRPDSPLNYDPKHLCPTGLFQEESGSLLCGCGDDHTVYRFQENGDMEQLLGITPNRAYLIPKTQVRERVKPADLPDTLVFMPTGIVKRSDGCIYFIERGYQMVRAYHPSTGLETVFPYALYREYKYRLDAPDRAPIRDYHPAMPGSLALDASGTLYLTELKHACVLSIDLSKKEIRKVIEIARPKDLLRGGVAAIGFGPDGTAWILNSVSRAVEAYAPTRQGLWKDLNVRLYSVHGDDLHVRIGGAGIVLGN